MKYSKAKTMYARSTATGLYNVCVQLCFKGQGEIFERSDLFACHTFLISLVEMLRFLDANKGNHLCGGGGGGSGGRLGFFVAVV